MDAEAEAQERFIREAAAQAADPNRNSHVGYYTQRPALSPLGGPSSVEELKASLPPEAGEVEIDDHGDLVRYVQETREQVKDEHGVVFNVVEDVPRYVALTQDAAKASSAAGRETDWWNGATWFRRGYKPERELWINPVERRTKLVRADEATQALFERDAHRKAAAEPVLRTPDAVTRGTADKE